MKHLPRTILPLSLLALLGVASAAQAQDSIRHGRLLLQEFCGHCHAIGRTGVVRGAPAFRTLGLGDPKDIYDAIITAGFAIRKGEAGTLGELSPKPHPWLYAEACRVGLGIPFEERNAVFGIEDSGAGVCSIRLAGFPVFGFAGGNIVASGTKELCEYFCETFEEISAIIK